MLYYTEFGLSHAEVPGESSLCIYLSGCKNRCDHCHYPALQRPDYGDPLLCFFPNIVDLYLTQTSCVCFLGEGDNTEAEKREFTICVQYAHHAGLKTCLYSGRDVSIEPWMAIFDYVKVGSFQEKLGPLENPSTNQRMYQNIKGRYVDITSAFWKIC